MRRLSPILVTALITAFAAAPLAEARQTKPATITVSGTGTATYTPRKYRVDGNFDAKDGTSAGALSKVSGMTAAAKKALRSVGVKRSQLRIEAPWSRRATDGNGRPTEGFIATQSLTVKVPVKQLNKALKAYDAIAQANGAPTSGPDWSARAQKGAEGRAAAAAVEDARMQAEREAARLKLTLGRVISIGEEPSRGGFGMRAALNEGAPRSRGGNPTQFDKPETQTVQGYRTVTFEAR